MDNIDLSSLDQDLFADINDSDTRLYMMGDVLDKIVERLGYKGRQAQFAELLPMDPANFSRLKNEKSIPSATTIEALSRVAAEHGYFLSQYALTAHAVFTADQQALEERPDAFWDSMKMRTRHLPPYARRALMLAIEGVVSGFIALYNQQSTSTPQQLPPFYRTSSDDNA